MFLIYKIPHSFQHGLFRKISILDIFNVDDIIYYRIDDFNLRDDNIAT